MIQPVTWRLPCGHVADVEGSTDIADVPEWWCADCFRESLMAAEDTAGEPDWHKAERLNSYHFDAFSWKLDPPTDERMAR